MPVSKVVNANLKTINFFFSYALFNQHKTIRFDWKTNYKFV